MKQYRRVFVVCMGLLIFSIVPFTQSLKIYKQPISWQQKVDPHLLALEESTETEFLVRLTKQADLSTAVHLPSKETKGAFVYEQLTAVAQQTQAPLLNQLEAAGASYRPFWIVNMVWVKGEVALIQAIAQRDDVAAVVSNTAVPLHFQPLPDQNERWQPTAVEWNILKINADLAWQLGITGEGVTIGGQDTGYNWTHPALKEQYRGWNGAEADHDYNWHDAIKMGGNSVCGSDSPEPCDDISSSHGTHTMGTAVGYDGITHIGVAPDAKWIGCRNMNEGDGTPATYTECYEWFVAPYPIGGNPMTDGDPSKAPHVINNSWSCPPSEGCDPTSMQMVVQNVRAAGIVPVHSAGNQGPGCQTVNTPAGHFPSSFTVGSTMSNDAISFFSSRGPATIDGESWLKPDITAPGSSIRSAVGVKGYGSLSGTSMAAPHVAGLVALVISADPALAGDVDSIEAIIQESAKPLLTGSGCGGDTSQSMPNHTFGHGRIDAYNAIQTVIRFEAFYLPFVVNE